MDFGIARAMGDAGMTMTQTAAVIGTAQYLSPEQAKGEQVDARSDLYSTGCLLYELLTGRPPFIGDSPVAVAYQHVREAPNPPSYYDPEVPPVVDAIVMKALAKSPDERYQSADEMRADLERALDGRPVAAAPTVAAGFGAAAPTAVMAPPGGRGYNAGGGYGSPPAQTRYEPGGYQSGSGEGVEDEIPRSRRATPATTGGRKANKNDKTGWIILSVVVIVLVVLAGLVYKTVFSGGTGTTGTVPTITGLTQTQAQQTLQDSNFKLGTSLCGPGSSSNAIPAGRILKQNPQSGAAEKTGTAVDYCVSSGPVVLTMPKQSDVNAASGTSVVNELKGKGYLNVGTKTESSNSVPSGNAIDIQNANGTSELGKDVPVTTPLVVVVSGGPNTETVPSVANQTCTAAAAMLKAGPYDFDVTTTEEPSPNGVPQNYAIGTNPGANSSAQVGSQVTLYCSTGPTAQQTTPTTNPTATSTDTGGNGGGFLGGLGGDNGGGPGN
jgi:serine/threonine-protein kinase